MSDEIKPFDANENDEDVDSRGHDRASYILGTCESYDDEVKREGFLALSIKNWSYVEAADYLKDKFKNEWTSFPSHRTLRRWAARYQDHIMHDILLPESLAHAIRTIKDPKESTRDKNQIMQMSIEQERGKPKVRVESKNVHLTLDYNQLMELNEDEATNEDPVPVEGRLSDSE